MKKRFLFFKDKKNKEEVTEMTRDEEEIKKAREDIDRKGKDSQTKRDREDESVGEQERRSGNENSQDAKARIDESEGTKRYDEKRAEEKRREDRDERRDDRREDERKDDRFDRLLDSVERLISAMENRNLPNAIQTNGIDLPLNQVYDDATVIYQLSQNMVSLPYPKLFK